MKNMQIAGTGNSRFMKSAISETATWEECRAMLRAGTFAFDFNGINEAGITEKGTPYDVENVLKDSTAALLGGDANMVPDEALQVLKRLIEDGDAAAIASAPKVVIGSYTGANANSKTLTFDFDPKVVLIAGESQYSAFAILVQGATAAMGRIGDGNGGNYGCSLSWGTKSVTISDATSPAYCFNYSGKYHYCALG